MTYHAKVIAGGKIVIPAELRREMGIKDGDLLAIERQNDGGLSIKTFKQVIQEGRTKIRQIFGPDYTVDQFIAENRADWGAE